MARLPASSPIEPGVRIPLEGALNFRDLGGWPTTAGGTVAAGVAYRCDNLANLTDDDHLLLNALGISTVIDFRVEVEHEQLPSRLWDGVKSHLLLPMAEDLVARSNFIDDALNGRIDHFDEEQTIGDYVQILSQSAISFGQAAAAVAEGDVTLFHCTAGKDRTGLMAMFLLSVAEVDRPSILTDFELSNRYRTEARLAYWADKFIERGLDPERFRAGFDAPRPAMDLALEWLDQNFGGPVGYLRHEGGVADDQLSQLRRRLQGEQ